MEKLKLANFKAFIFQKDMIFHIKFNLTAKFSCFMVQGNAQIKKTPTYFRRSGVGLFSYGKQQTTNNN